VNCGATPSNSCVSHQRERRSAVQIATRYGVEVQVGSSLLHTDACRELETPGRARTTFTVRASRVAELLEDAAGAHGGNDSAAIRLDVVDDRRRR